MIVRGEEALMSDEPRGGFTRRDLVRGSLVGAIAAGVGTKAGPAEPGPIGPGAAPLELTVNGKVHRMSVEPRVTLVEALRDRIGLTGTKVVCGRGACGACTVLVDGRTVCSCLMLAHEATGKSIATIEGLAAGGRLTPLQEAFIAADALQCGFCTSGMILSCQALLEREPKPSRQAIREAVAGNLCRCGTYNHVFDAVERAAGLKTAQGASPTVLARSGLPPDGSRRMEDDPRVGKAIREAMEEEGLA
jgi:xanthine dehydrogenase YagT iron-sulfur-binding subunit